MNMDQNFINNGMEILKNTTTLAAKVATAGNNGNQQQKKPDNLNQAHNQTVEVKLGEPSADYHKPIVLHEKKETHIHKPFPEGRALSDQECEIEKLRLENEHELKMKELNFRIQQEDYARIERKEREDRERKEREARRERERKFNRRLGIGFAAIGVVGLGAIGWDLYTNSRRNAGGRMALREPAGNGAGTISLTPDEGSVK